MRPFARATTIIFAGFTSVVLTTGCDSLNKPLSSPSTSSGGSASTSADAGDRTSEDDVPAPAPSFTAQPTDIQL